MKISKNKRIVMVMGIIAVVVIGYMIYKSKKEKNDE